MSALIRLEVNEKSKNISDGVEHVAMVTRSADWEEPMTYATFVGLTWADWVLGWVRLSSCCVYLLVFRRKIPKFNSQILLCLSITINFFKLGHVLFHLALKLKYVLSKRQSRRITFFLSGDPVGDPHGMPCKRNCNTAVVTFCRTILLQTPKKITDLNRINLIRNTRLWEKTGTRQHFNFFLIAGGLHKIVVLPACNGW